MRKIKWWIQLRERVVDDIRMLRGYVVLVAVRRSSNISDDGTGRGSIYAVCAQLSKPRESAELDEGSTPLIWERRTASAMFYRARPPLAQSHDRINEVLPFSI